MDDTAGGRKADAARGRVGTGLLRLSAALILVNGLLLAPEWILAGSLGPAWLSLEACVVVALFALLPRARWATGLACITSIVVTCVALVALGDTVIQVALSRPMSFFVDVWLLASGYHLLRGALGSFGATLALLIGGLLVIGLTGLLAYLLSSAGRAGAGGRFPRLATLVAFARALPLAPLAVATVVLLVGIGLDRVPVLDERIDAPSVRLVTEQVARYTELRGLREEFAVDLERAPSDYADLPGLLDGLGGRDVIFAFIESYGISSIRDPRYAPVIGPRLDDLEERARAAGLHLVSGSLVAPSQGGQSWFAHGSVLSGLWLDEQPRYEMMLASGRETLVDDFGRAGYRTVALMPAITMAWPEGARLGYDQVYARNDIDYAGPALNWVTMPDQFTWSFLENEIRSTEPDRPLFAEVGLISSHAPWTPILTVLDDWDSIGNGMVFERWRDAGMTPRELWRDGEMVREHYARSVEYAVHTMVSYAERYVDSGTLLVVLGDHQPAPLITGDGASWAVPVHVLSGDRSVVEPFLEWGFVPGAWPDAEREPLGVDYFRDWFLRAYSEAGPPETRP